MVRRLVARNHPHNSSVIHVSRLKAWTEKRALSPVFKRDQQGSRWGRSPFPIGLKLSRLCSRIYREKARVPHEKVCSRQVLKRVTQRLVSPEHDAAFRLQELVSPPRCRSGLMLSLFAHGKHTRIDWSHLSVVRREVGWTRSSRPEVSNLTLSTI